MSDSLGTLGYSVLVIYMIATVLLGLSFAQAKVIGRLFFGRAGRTLVGRGHFRSRL